MRRRGYGSLIFGGLLILLGVLLLIDNLDVLGDWEAPFWSLVLGAFGLVFVGVYLNDREQWWALIPGLVILGVAAAVFLGEQELVADHVVATVVLAGVALPFYLIFLIDRQHWWALIPALTMTGVAAGVFLEGEAAVSGEAVGGLIVGGIGVGFLSIYLIDREQWWALIPGGIMAVVAFFLLLATAGRYVLPAALIVLGLLLLRGSLGRGRREAGRAEQEPVLRSGRKAGELPGGQAAEGAASETSAAPREKLPSLEEQIEAAVAEATDPEEPAEPEPDTET